MNFRSLLAPFSALALCLTAFGAGAAEQGLWEREKLTGDWGGARSALADRGVTVTLDYIGETLSVLRGGLQRGTSYEGRLDGIVNTDLEKLIGWKGGSTHVRAFQIHKGRHNAADLVGSIADPSNIDATSTTRLFTAWFQQDFGKAGSIRVGQLAADDEFLTSTTAGGLINGTFGWATMLASNLPSGGAAYPLATPGARLQVNLTESFSLLGRRVQRRPGRPALLRRQSGRQSANLQQARHDIQLARRNVLDRRSAISGQSGEGRDRFGGRLQDRRLAPYRQRFADQRFGDDGTGNLVSLATEPPLPFNHRDNWGIYGVIDQMLWRNNGKKRQRVRARGRLAVRPQSDFALYRRRHRLQGTVSRPPRRHAHARRRAFENLKGRRRARSAISWR